MENPVNIYIGTEKKSILRSLDKDNFYCYNKLSDLVYKGYTNFFYKLINNDFYFSPGTCCKLLYNVKFEDINVNELTVQPNMHPDVLFQLIILCYTLYKEKIHYDNLKIDVYDAKKKILIDICIGGAIIVSLKTNYYIKLNTLTKLSSMQLLPEMHYVNKLRQTHNIEWNMVLKTTITKINDINFISLILFQFDYIKKNAVGITHGGLLSSRELNKYQNYDIGTVVEFRFSPIKIVRGILISNIDIYNNIVWVYDLENNKLEEKELSTLKLIEGMVIGNSFADLRITI